MTRIHPLYPLPITVTGRPSRPEPPEPPLPPDPRFCLITLGEARQILAQRLYDSGPPNQMPAPTQFHSAPL